MIRSVDVLGVRVDDVTTDEALARVEEFVQQPREQAYQIATINPEFIMIARRRPEFAHVLETTDLNLPDGANLVRATKLLGRPLRERVAGSDLIWRLAERSAERGWKIYLLGARDGVANDAAAKLRERYPGLEIVGARSGSAEAREDGESVRQVRARGTQLLFVAYGAPAQDFWISRVRSRLPGCVAMGVGGSFDFIAGRVPRAPAWVQRAGLEWLFRLSIQPWRARRQLALIEFAWLVLRSRR